MGDTLWSVWLDNWMTEGYNINSFQNLSPDILSVYKQGSFSVTRLSRMRRSCRRSPDLRAAARGPPPPACWRWAATLRRWSTSWWGETTTSSGPSKVSSESQGTSQKIRLPQCWFNSSFTNFAFMRTLPSFTKFVFMRNAHVYMH